jgi:photosystem II stability/assembly factor-like uncharacterized protein
MKKTLILSAIAFALSSANAKAQTWDTIVTGIPMSTIDGLIPSCFEILPLENGTLLGCTAGSIHRSTNYGDTWTTLPYIYSPTGIAVNGYNGFHKVNDGRILALGFGGLIGNAISKSDDDGMTWVASFSGIDPSSNGNVTIEDASVSPDGTIYIAARQVGGVYASTNNGDSWEEKATDISESLWSILAVDDNTILAGASDGIHRSTDGGTTWTHVLNTSSSSGYVMTMVKNSVGTIYAGLASGIVRKSTDDGLTWSNSTLTGSGAMVYDIEIDSEDNIYVAIYLGGIARFDNAETPTGIIGYEALGLVNTRVMDIAIDETGSEPIYYASSSNTTGTGGCMYRSGYDSGVGISEMKTENTIAVFPNPANTQIQISGVNLNSGAQLQIISMDGRVVKNEKVYHSSINVADLATGQYIVKITDDEGKMSVGMFVRQ